jgi:hypothetical protein
MSTLHDLVSLQTFAISLSLHLAALSVDTQQLANNWDLNSYLMYLVASRFVITWNQPVLCVGNMLLSFASLNNCMFFVLLNCAYYAGLLKVQNSRCETLTDRQRSRYLTRTVEGSWSLERFELKTGVNVLFWRVVAPTTTSSRLRKPVLIQNIDISGKSYYRPLEINFMMNVY